jgi:hypothetical protein
MPGLFGLYAAETVIRYLLKKSSWFLDKKKDIK